MVGFLSPYDLISNYVIIVNMVNEETSGAKLFLYNPDLVTLLGQLVQPDKQIDFKVQMAAVYALESIAHYRSKLSDVLAAVNASANHGILIYSLSMIASSLESESSPYPSDWVDAWLSFLSYITSTSTGGSLLINAGIIPLFVQVS